MTRSQSPWPSGIRQEGACLRFVGLGGCQGCLKSLCAILIVFVLLFAGNLIPQDNLRSGVVAGDNQYLPTLAVQVDEVSLSFFVADRHHRWIENLAQDELRLRDNGRPPESIRLFQQQTGTPLRLGVLVDVSDSIAQRFAYERDAAATFITQMLDSTKDLAFVAAFNERPAVAQDLTGDAQALAAAIHKLDLGGATAIYDAIYFACRRLIQRSDSGLTRRVLVVLTDGNDNCSHFQPKETIENAIRANVTIIVLHTESSPDTSDPKYKVLERLVRETGGQIVSAATKKQMANAFTQLSLQIRNSYLLAYRPAGFKRDGSYRRIQLKSTRRGVHIICRHGYYAVGDNSD